MTFTVITADRVIQVHARSYNVLVNALAETGFKWLGIHAVEEEQA